MIEVASCILTEELENVMLRDGYYFPEERKFSCIVPLLSEGTELHADWLYVGLLSEVAARLEGDEDLKEICFACIGDTEDAGRLDSEHAIIAEPPETERGLFSKLQSKLYEIQSWYYKMADAINEGCSLQRLLDISEPYVCNYIAVSDSELKLLAYTRHIECNEPICVRLREKGFHDEESQEIFEKTGRYDIWEKQIFYIGNDPLISQFPFVGRVFQFHDTYFMHSVMTCVNRPPTRALLARYNIFLDCFGILVGKEWNKIESFTHVYDTFLNNLISGKLKRREIVEKRSKYVGIPSYGPFSVVLVEMDPHSDDSPSHLAHEFGSAFQRAKIIIFREYILMLYIFDDAFYEKQKFELKEKLMVLCSRFSLRCTVSSKIKYLWQCKLGLDQDQQLITLLNSMSKANCGLEPYCVNKVCWKLADKKVYFYDDYYQYCMQDYSPEAKNAGNGSRYFRALEKLYMYDMENKMNNLQLLRVYLSSERSLVITGEKMHMHRNNVSYRIKKINSIINLDLDDPENRLKLLIAYTQYDLQCGVFLQEGK